MSYTRLIAVLGRLFPPGERDWAAAMLAELEIIADPGQRTRFANGCLWALVRRQIANRLRVWGAQPWMLCVALATGFLIALSDQASDTRIVMWLTLLPASALFAWWQPAAAWRWGLLLAAGMPLLAAFNDYNHGPYAFDHGDAMFGILPAVLVALIVSWLRRRIRPERIALVALGVFASSTTASAQSKSGFHELTTGDVEAFAESAFAEYLQRSFQPSLAFVVVKDGAVVFARGYGKEDAAGTRGVDPAKTVFWMASLSKLITADAVMREVECGRIGLESPAAQYLGWSLPSRRGWRPITVKDLLTHTAGLDEPFMVGSENDDTRLIPLGNYLRQIRWRASNRPGDLLRYSNHGMALAGHTVERTSGTSFAKYVEREIFIPLGMTSSTFRQPVPAELAQRIATAGTDVARDYLLSAPAGAMVGTANDMARFLIAQLDTSGPRATSLRAMHATQWRAHQSVPGVALGWFETELGGVRGLYHTGARHHFSVAWLSPSHGIGLFLVHSMRQGGPFQNLRTDVVRAFTERYLVPDVHREPVTTAPQAADGVYRPEILSGSTVERAGYLFLDTPVRTTADGSITVRAPGGLGTITAYPTGDGAFEVRAGPQSGLRLAFLREHEQVTRLAMGGTLLDPIVFMRLKWWQRGFVHAAFLFIACFAIVAAAAVQSVRRIMRRRRRVASNDNPGWTLVIWAGILLTLSVLAFAGTIVTTPEIGAAAHMRTGIRAVLLLLSATAVLCLALPVVTVVASSRTCATPRRVVPLNVVCLAAVIVAVLLWHYRLVGFNL